MGGLTPVITGKLVAFDSAPLIYYVEEHPDYVVVADELFDAIDRGLAHGTTSVLTLLEVLVVPVREGQHDLADQYRQLLMTAEGVALHVIDEDVCERAAQLRAKYGWLRTPDALQVATAIEHGAEVIVTNDDRWRRLTEIEVVILKDYVVTHP
jgi:predicted nucleic acid-binding protein